MRRWIRDYRPPPLGYYPLEYEVNEITGVRRQAWREMQSSYSELRGSSIRPPKDKPLFIHRIDRGVALFDLKRPNLLDLIAGGYLMEELDFKARSLLEKRMAWEEEEKARRLNELIERLMSR